MDILSFLRFISFLLSFGIPYTLAIGEESSSNSNGGENLVFVMSQEHDPIEMYVKSNGDLSYVELSPTLDVYEATAISSVRAKCFYWRRDGRMTEEGTTSGLFTVGNTRYVTMETVAFEGAERVYCYDGSQDDSGGSTVAIFLDAVSPTSEQDSGLIKVKIGQDDDFAEQSLYGIQPQLRVSVSAKIIDIPRRGGSSYFPSADEELDFDDQIGADDDMRERNAGCYLLYNGYRGLSDAVILEGVEARNIGRLTDFEKVVCFRDMNDQRLKRRWLQLDSQR